MSDIPYYSTLVTTTFISSEGFLEGDKDDCKLWLESVFTMGNKLDINGIDSP